LIATERMSLTGSQRFPKTARLRKRAEFLKLSRTGAKFQTANFVIITRASNRSENRLGVTVSGKVGNSVMRNRIKRRIREYFRRHRAELPPATDILVIARKSAAAGGVNIVADELQRALVGQGKRRK
jgi:ribonuclease P protein component